MKAASYAIALGVALLLAGSTVASRRGAAGADRRRSARSISGRSAEASRPEADAFGHVSRRI
jgi:hypothetical protein